MNSAFAGQGVQRMLYTVPNSTFIENPSGDANVVTINDTNGSISTLQSSIDNARSANPHSIIVINLHPGSTYTVSGAGLVLGSQECLIASGAIIQAADSSVIVPLIQITSGSTNVSISGGTLDGANANINGIYAPAAAHVNVDQVVVRNCGQDCILLKGNGNISYIGELTVTRCDCSGSAAHAGVSIQNSTQAAVLENYCHNNLIGIYLSCAWANVANNTCNNNTTGIQIAGGDDNNIANNTCNNNGTGISAGASKNMILSCSLGNNSTAGINSSGSGNIFSDNLFTSGNAINFISGGSGDYVVAYKGALSASGQNYFYPPLIDDQHTNTIVNGKGRTDLTITSTNIAAVQSQYNSARSSNPNNVIVLHLNGTFTVGATPLTLESNTCVLLNGTIQINGSTTANEAIQNGVSPKYISISGGTIDGGNIKSNNAILLSSSAILQIDSMRLQNFGAPNPRYDTSDIVHIVGGGTPQIVTRCTVTNGAARGIWFQNASIKRVVSDCEVTEVNQDGVDFDSSTSGSVAKFNYLHNNVRCGVFVEQSDANNLVLGNICNSNGHGVSLWNNSATPRGSTAYNSVLCNVCMSSGNGNLIQCGSIGTNIVTTSDNFIFDNALINGTVQIQTYGTNNYFSQNYFSGVTLTTATGVQSFFNSVDVDGYLQIHDNNSGLGVVVQNAATTNNAAIVTATPSAGGDGTGDDEWQFIPTGNGYYRVMNGNSALAMVVQGASTANGAAIIQYAYTADSTYNDDWLIQLTGTGSYNFINHRSGLNLEVPGGSTTPGMQLDQWQSTGGLNQQFSLVEDTAVSSPDFNLSATPSSQIISAGDGTSYTVTLSSLNGFGGTVDLTISGLPDGATASFNPTSITGSGNSTLNVSTSANTPGGSYTLIITGTSGSLQHSTSVTLAISDFTISVTPSSQTVNAGNNVNYTVTVGSLNGFAGTVNLIASGLPSDATAAFNPASIDSAGSSTLTITTSNSTPVGTNTLTITGTSGTLVHSATATLQVTPVGSTWTTVNDTDAGITYSGHWSYSSNRNHGDYNNDVHDTQTNGDYAQYTFNGTGVQFITETYSDESNVDIYLDDVYQTTVNCYSATRQSQVAVYSNAGLSSGWHTIKIVKNGGTYLLLDAFSYIAGAPQPPLAPTGLMATAGNAQVALSWTASSGATSYNVKRATVSGGPYTTIANVASTGYTDTNVVNGTTYYYVVSAVNSAGESANSSEVSATPQAPQLPAPPTNLSASGAKRKVTLTWTQSVSPGIASNKVYRSSTSGGPYTLLTTLSPTTSYTDTGLQSRTTYYYVVTAVDSNGLESLYSNQATGTAK